MNWRRNSIIPESEPGCQHQTTPLNHKLAIISIDNNSRLRSANLNKEFTLPLKTQGHMGEVWWYLDGNKLPGKSSKNHSQYLIVNGVHELLAIDETGAMDRVQFFVEGW